MNLNKILFVLLIIFSNFIYSKKIIPNYSLTHVNRQISDGFMNYFRDYKIQTRKEKGEFPGKYIFSCCDSYEQKLDNDLEVVGAYKVAGNKIFQILPCKLGSRSIVIVSQISKDAQNINVISVLDENGNYQKEISIKSTGFPYHLLEAGQDAFAMITSGAYSNSILNIWDFEENNLFQIALYNDIYSVSMVKASEGKFIVAYSNRLELWSSNGSMIKLKELGTDPGSCAVTSIVKLNDIVAVSFYKSGTIRTFDIDSLEEQAAFEDLKIDNISNLYKSKDKQQLIVFVLNYFSPNKLFILDVKTRAIINSCNINVDFFASSNRRFMAVVPNQPYIVCCETSINIPNIYLIDFNGNMLAQIPLGYWIPSASIKFLSEDTFCVQDNKYLNVFKINNLNNPANKLLIRK